ncbi:MAG: dihydrolipoyl dehydrogenase [Candidatus Phocaeicola faecigallinarum]|uniref:Dihydrolipoyl dehydrogenase n=1 Tax=Candidatus Phocaeicola faecigallinarum TaxID=2838732 RepID=A0A948TBA1_9BACT|nr:dihydrolipoyl dehydrogenase [Candidatus Phocaeicola faecigallinarum]
MDFQLAIIGGGPAGYSAAEAAGKAGLNVVLFEKNALGGVCLNEGCIPTKTLLYSAKVFDGARNASKYAVKVDNVSFDIAKIVSRKQKVVRKLVLGLKNKMSESGVTVVTGEAYIQDKNTIKCGDEVYKCEKLMLCTGSKTFVPPVKGLEKIDFWTHREALDCKELPESLVIIGGGVIGMEFASYFCSLGVKVTVVEMTSEILGGIDKEIASLLRAEYTKKGITFMLDTKVTEICNEDSGKVIVKYQTADGDGTVETDKLLVSAGRHACTEGYGLENLSLEFTPQNRIKVDTKTMMTSVDGVYACGDITGFSMLAHTAVREAEVAVSHICGKDDNMSYKAIPGVVYTNPEVASVGMTEEMAKAVGFDYKVMKLPMAYAGRFVAENEGVNGICKVITTSNDTIIGAHILGNPASELIVIAGMMIERGKKLEDFKKFVFPHPTVGEIFREF